MLDQYLWFDKMFFCNRGKQLEGFWQGENSWGDFSRGLYMYNTGQKWAGPKMGWTKFGRTKYGLDQIWMDQIWVGPNLVGPKMGWTKNRSDQIWLDQIWVGPNMADQKWPTKSVSTKSGLTPFYQLYMQETGNLNITSLVQ